MLSAYEKELLLKIARNAIVASVKGSPLEKIILADLPEKLKENGASFITLTINNNLRGCIGALEAYQPLANDVQEHAVTAASDDFRFSPVSEREIDLLKIEISRLSPLKALIYEGPEDLMNKLRPGVDGVLIRDGIRRATFLPQVWEKINRPDEFLSHLCLKMNAHPDLWRQKHLEVYVYQVEEFKEE